MPATILVVEDHDAVRESLRDWLLVEFPQHRVLAAASGEEAIALVLVESPCLIVMDISLPGISGIEATRQIKTILPSIPVVILTIHEGDTYRADAAAAGASAYVPKRTMQTGLIAVLAALLEGNPLSRHNRTYAEQPTSSNEHEPESQSIGRDQGKVFPAR